jgi:hypothetical protein
MFFSTVDPRQLEVAIVLITSPKFSSAHVILLLAALGQTDEKISDIESV